MTITLPREQALDQGYKRGRIKSVDTGKFDENGTYYLQLTMAFRKIRLTKRFFYSLDYQCASCRTGYHNTVDKYPECGCEVIFGPFYWVIHRIFSNLGIKPLATDNGDETFDESDLVDREVLELLFNNCNGYIDIFNLLKPDASKTQRGKSLVQLESYLERISEKENNLVEVLDNKPK